jgi:hypothetical protein
MKLSIFDTFENYYFMEGGFDDIAVIIVRKSDSAFYIYLNFLNDFESFFSIEYPYSKDVLKNYIEKTLGVKLSNIPFFD